MFGTELRRAPGMRLGLTKGAGGSFGEPDDDDDDEEEDEPRTFRQSDLAPDFASSPRSTGSELLQNQ